MLRQLCQKSRNTRLIFFFFPKYSSVQHYRRKVNQIPVFPDIYNSEIHRPGKPRKEQNLSHITSTEMCSLISRNYLNNLSFLLSRSHVKLDLELIFYECLFLKMILLSLKATNIVGKKCLLTFCSNIFVFNEVFQFYLLTN